MLFPHFPGKHYSPRFHYHLGDKWARLNFALRLMQSGSIALEHTFPLPKYGRLISRLTASRTRTMQSQYPFVLVLDKNDETACEIIEALDLGDFSPPIFYTDRPTYFRFGTLIDNPDGYACPYYPTKITHQSENQTIAIALGSGWNSEAKLPPDLKPKLKKLKNDLKRYNFVEITIDSHPNIPSLIKELSKAVLLISVDNGVAHVARSVGTPLFLIEHELSLDRGFPTFACKYHKVTVDTIGPIVYHYTKGLSDVHNE